MNDTPLFDIAEQLETSSHIIIVISIYHHDIVISTETDSRDMF